MLRRAVMLLRVTMDDSKKHCEPTFDGLDQPEDSPKPTEKIFVYVNTGKNNGTAHIRFGGKSRRASGFYQRAEYRLYDVQPPDDILRDNAKWRAWCETQRERLGL